MLVEIDQLLLHGENGSSSRNIVCHSQWWLLWGYFHYFRWSSGFYTGLFFLYTRWCIDISYSVSDKEFCMPFNLPLKDSDGKNTQIRQTCFQIQACNYWYPHGLSGWHFGPVMCYDLLVYPHSLWRAYNIWTSLSIYTLPLFNIRRYIKTVPFRHSDKE